MKTHVPEICVVIPAELRLLCGGRIELSLAAGTVRALLAELKQKYPEVHVRVCDEQGQPRPHINVFINDQLCPRTELHAPLAAGDVVSILPAVSGG
jgi:molybdopterin converting factor small subunit